MRFYPSMVIDRLDLSTTVGKRGYSEFVESRIFSRVAPVAAKYYRRLLPAGLPRHWLPKINMRTSQEISDELKNRAKWAKKGKRIRVRRGLERKFIRNKKKKRRKIYGWKKINIEGAPGDLSPSLCVLVQPPQPLRCIRVFLTHPARPFVVCLCSALLEILSIIRTFWQACNNWLRDREMCNSENRAAFRLLEYGFVRGVVDSCATGKSWYSRCEVEVEKLQGSTGWL